jgi:hypothetical protein
MRLRIHDLLFSFGCRAALAGAWCLAAVVGLRIPGWLRELDVVLLLVGVGFFVYSLIRYGLPAAQWNNRRVDAAYALRKANVTPSPLVEHLARAIDLRHTLPAAERGKSPDDELLDTQSYRKLISSGVTTTAELCGLGGSIARALKLDAKDDDDRRFTDIARDAGLDTESALFYRDLAIATADIGLANEVAQITNAM